MNGLSNESASASGYSGYDAGEGWFVRNRRVLMAGGVVLAIVLVWRAIPKSDKNRSPSSYSEDQRSLVGLFTDYTDPDVTPLESFFAKDSPRPDGEYWRRVKLADIQLTDRPSVSGAQATLRVKIDGTKFDWAFVKEGDEWKVKSAPLP